jgi:hypothetical protein
MDPNKIRLGDTLRNLPELRKEVEARRDLVAEVVDLATATAVWDRTADEQGRDVLVLQLRDDFGAESEGKFAPWELRNESQLRRRVGDLLWAAFRVKDWRTQLTQLHEKVRQWVQEDDDLAHFEELQCDRSEERSGPYEVPMLIIHTRGATARLEPVARWVVGAEGRVDLIGEDDRAILVVDKNNVWSWIRQSGVEPGPHPLNKDLFLNLLRAVL